MYCDRWPNATLNENEEDEQVTAGTPERGFELEGAGLKQHMSDIMQNYMLLSFFLI